MIGVPLSIYIGKSFAISGKETNALRRIVFLYNKSLNYAIIKAE